ncbi:MAG TPA: transcription elongation factor GreA [Bacteroidia bacterium]|nr:transcription elongation factor GreA [Bacteroidia bacterium]
MHSFFFCIIYFFYQKCYNLPMTYYVTKEKKIELEAELKKLINSGRKEISERLDESKALGDLKENAEFHQAREDQGKMEARIEELEVILKESEIVEHKNKGEVEVGAKVEVKKDGKKKIFEIVGRQEVDISTGKIALDSPLAKELIGKHKGDKFTFLTPGGDKVDYEILKVS